MIQRSPAIRRFIKSFPGYKTFGVYAFLPVFFVFGGLLEYTMIHWKPGGTNFYHTFKRNQSKAEAERRLAVLLSEAEKEQAV